MSEQQKPKYITSSIRKELVIDMKILLWIVWDELKNKRQEEMDYLQVFDITTTKEHIKILNKQEQPKIEEGLIIDNPRKLDVNRTVWIIDESEYATMLFPEDY